MNKERIIELLKNEAECVRRQDTPECNRDTNGCQCCDLLVETEEILKAYGEAVEIIQNARVAYLCDGNNCPVDKASCKHGGPCRHTTNIEHAINFRRFHDTDAFYEVENVMRIEGQEN